MESIELELIPAPDDLRVNDPAFQAELRDVTASLRMTGAEFSTMQLSLHAVGALDYQLAEFAIKSLGPAVVAGAAGVLGTWIGARSGRKLRVKIGDVKAEAHTPEEIAALLTQAAEFRRSAGQSDGNL